MAAEAERKRQAAAKAAAEAERMAELELLKAEIAAVSAAIKAAEERVAKLPRPRVVENGYGYYVLQYSDGRRKYNEFLTGYSKMLEPDEPVPAWRPRWAG